MALKLKVVLFTDQVKFTVNTNQRTNNEIEMVARQQDELTIAVLRLTGGTLLKDTGDGCFAEFSSVLGAAQAGVLIQRRVAERNAAQENNRMRFDLHIGIDVGELVVLPNGDLRGAAANRCARICSECPAGEVYLSDDAARMLKQNEVELELANTLALKGIEGNTKLYRIALLRAQPTGTLNPFVQRDGITSADDFFDRQNEQQTLRAYLHGRTNCQIVGPRRIGKTSLLKQIERVARTWEQDAIVAYLDLQDARCVDLSGWLKIVSRKFGWAPPATSLAEFAEYVEDMLSGKQQPVLCLDEFEELTLRRPEFGRDFFMNLRACGQQGMVIFTSSREQLNRLTEPRDPSSPFYNTFPLMELGPFSDADAHDFVIIHRPGVPSFTSDEREAILEFGKGHPLFLQVACFHVLERKKSSESLTEALRKAADGVRAILPRT